jgi:preprotein translocase subunit YajC
VDPFSLMMMAVLALLVFFMFRNSRKQRQTQLELQEKLVPGAKVMTSFGLYATLVSIDDDTNVAVIKTGKSTTLEVHRQVLTKVIEDEVPADDASSETTSKKS